MIGTTYPQPAVTPQRAPRRSCLPQATHPTWIARKGIWNGAAHLVVYPLITLVVYLAPLVGINSATENVGLALAGSAALVLLVAILSWSLVRWVGYHRGRCGLRKAIVWALIGPGRVVTAILGALPLFMRKLI